MISFAVSLYYFIVSLKPNSIIFHHIISNRTIKGNVIWCKTS
jgi:hypothetical protein